MLIKLTHGDTDKPFLIDTEKIILTDYLDEKWFLLIEDAAKGLHIKESPDDIMKIIFRTIATIASAQASGTIQGQAAIGSQRIAVPSDLAAVIQKG